MPFWRISRVRGQLAAALALAAGVAGLDWGVSAAIGWNALEMAGQDSQTYTRLEQASSRALALAKAAHDGQKIGLSIGMSTAEQGVDLRLLEGVGEPLSWSKITGEHASFTNMLEVVERVSASGLQPKRTLLCIHYGMLVGAERIATSRHDQWLRVVSRADHLNLFGEATRALQLTWLGKNRAATVNTIEMGLGRLRGAVLTWFEQGPAVNYGLDREPFADSVNTRSQRARAAWQGRLLLAKNRGWDRPGSYSAASVQGRAFTKSLTTLGPGRGVVIVLMPEHSALRALIPVVAARQALDATIAAAKFSRPPPVLDFREALPDELFVDEAHPTARGRTQESLALRAALSALPR